MNWCTVTRDFIFEGHALRLRKVFATYRLYDEINNSVKLRNYIKIIQYVIM